MPSDAAPAVCVRIREARAAAGHETTEAGGRAVGVRSGIYWKHENTTEPSLEAIEHYARAFGVSPCWLAFGVPEPAHHAPPRRFWLQKRRNRNVGKPSV